VRGKDNVLAILLADIHLSLKAPIWRSAEPDWLEAQARPLKQVRLLQSNYGCPVLCAGDIFDRSRKTADGWNAPAELINYAIQYLPDNMYAIPGQHDLPNHQYDDIHRSAYWTLVKAGKIRNVKPNCMTDIGEGLLVYGFPPGYELIPLEISDVALAEGKILVAIVHDYIWVTGHSYPEAPMKSNVLLKRDRLRSYDVAVYGDNHRGFLAEDASVRVFNCGTLMRRKADEIDYKPQVGLLLDDGSVVPHYLDTSEDRYIAEAEVQEAKTTLEMGDFFDELGKLGKTFLDFVEVMKEIFLRDDKISSEAKQIILDAMEK